MLLTAVVFQPVSSQEPEPSAPAVLPTWTLQTIDGPRLFTNMRDRSLAFRPDGTPCAAYGGDGLYYACYNSTTELWQSQVVDNNIGVGQYAALAFFTSPVTGNTDAFISYYDAYNGELKFVYTLNNVWQAPITVPNPAPGTLAPATNLADEPFDPARAPAEEERNFEDEMRQFTLLGLNPSQQQNPDFVIETTGVGQYTSIAVDGNGVYISYYDAREIINDPDDWTQNIYERNLKVAIWKGGTTWEIDLVDDYHDQGKVGLWSSIAVDFNGNLHVAYFDEKYDDLKYAFWKASNEAWEDPVTVAGQGGSQNEPREGSMCSIALRDEQLPGVKGTPYISFLDWTETNGKPDGALKIAKLQDLGTNDWDIDVLDTVGITGWWTSIAIDNINNRIYISYYQASEGGEATGDLRLATKRTSQDWTFETVRERAGMVGQFSSIAIRPSNLRPSILHYNAAKGKIEYTYYKNSTEWGNQEVDTSGNDVGYASSLALNSAGVPNISYLDVTFSLMKYARADSFFIQKYHPLSDFYSGYYSSIQLEGETHPRVAAYGSEDGDLIFGKLDSGVWDFEYIDRTYDVGQYVSMGWGSDNRARVSYYDATNKNLVFAYSNVGATSWVTDTLDAPIDDIGRFTSLTLSPDNRAYISYYDEEHEDLRIAYQTPPFGFWQYETVDDGGVLEDNVGWFSSIALDNAGNPHISYYDETNENLKYAYWNGSGWIIETLQSAGDVGLYTSLKIYTPANTRHLCYYDLTNGALMYAQYSAGMWEYQTVDGDGDVGYSCSIDLTAAGDIAISYYDNSRGDLRLATTFALPLMDLFFMPIVAHP
jgi:hypothetical protein